MKDTKRYTLCDTRFIPEYSEYIENCEINDRTPQEENSQDYWNFVSDCQQMEYDDLKLNMKYSKQCQVPVIITGNLGLWYGSPSIRPVRCETLSEAIDKCSNSADDIKVEYENGVVYVYGYHHDGTNCFEIHKLSSKGIKTSDSWFGHIAPTDECKGYLLAKFHGFLY